MKPVVDVTGGPAVGATLGRYGRTPEPTTARSGRGLLSRTAVRERSTAIAGVAIIALALVMRLINHASNYDIFVDEITYSSLGRAVAGGHGATLYGSPFFLHPPAFFYLEGALLRLFGTAKSSLALVFDLRLVNCVLGAVECGFVMLLVDELTQRWAALLAGLFVAVDPFLLRWDGRVVLETLAMTTALAGWLCVVLLADLGTTSTSEPQLSTRRQWQLVVCGGVMFGISLLTKETYAFVGVVPLAVLLALGAPIRRTRSGLILGIAVLCFIAYWLTVVANGQLRAWWNQQSVGLQRAAGTTQISGFNQAGHSTFASRLGSDLHLYLVSYLVVAATGLTAAIWALVWYRAARSGRQLPARRRLATVLSACAVAYIAYAGLLGAFEEQIFYMVLVAAIPLLAVSADAVWSRYGRGDRRLPLVACVVLGVVALGFELAVAPRAIRTFPRSSRTYGGTCRTSRASIRPTA